MDISVFNNSRMNIPTFCFTPDDHHQLSTIKSIANEMRHLLGRPLRVLELGCSPTFYGLHLAKSGDEVVGLDTNLDHVVYCQRFSKAHGLHAQFHAVGNYQTCFSAFTDRPFDLLLGVHVVADMAQRIGFEEIKQFVHSLTTRVSVALLDTVFIFEPGDGHKKFKPDPFTLLNDFAFVEPLCQPGKSFDVKKSWFFCSNFYWYTHQKLQPFTTWTDTSREIFSYEDFTITHKGKRRYYFTDTHILKHFRLVGRKTKSHVRELQTEIEFLKTHYSKLPTLPELVDYRMHDLSGWLLREKLPGIRLSTIIEQGQYYDPQQIITQVLQQLADLEEQGLYQQDIRTWNFIITDQGDVHMIDFGQIGSTPIDVLSKQRSNILTFFTFAYQVCQGFHLKHRHLAPMYLQVAYYPDYFQPLLIGIMNHHFKKWTYRLLLHYWQEGWSAVKKGEGTINLQAWLKEMEILKHTSQGFEPFEALFKKKQAWEAIKAACHAELRRWSRLLLTWVKPKSSLRLMSMLRRR